MRKKPTLPHNFYDIANLLYHEYGKNTHHNKRNPLTELFFILCSVRTDERLYLPVFKAMRKEYPSWNDILLDDGKNLENILRPAGLSKLRASQIIGCLKIIRQKFSKISLSPLKKLSNDEIEQFLIDLPGVNKKVARCVMLYSFDRNVFPVDIHCWRIGLRLGWIKSTNKTNICTLRDMDRYQDKIPSEYRFTLHINMLSHGRAICKSRKPLCGNCVINKYCRRINISRQQ